MLDFMIIGLPRSGTTWASNFFTTDKSLCLHDPLYTLHYDQLDQIEAPGKKVGISCTGLWRWPDFIKAHPARKIILRRPLVEINRSLAEIGLPPATQENANQLALLPGEHFLFSDLFNARACRHMAEHLGLPFDDERHAELINIEMQPKFSGLKVGADVTRQLVAELQSVLK